MSILTSRAPACSRNVNLTVPLFGLIASGQIQLRRIDGYQRLSKVLEHAEVTA